MTNPLLGRRLALLLATFGCAFSLNCGGGPSDPQSTSPAATQAQALQIICPAAQAAESPSGTAMPVSFPAPVTSGGAPPVTVACTPASGSSFSRGTTNVLCTANDATHQAATCGLTVSVTQPGALSKTRFMAFGDSITWGQLSGVGCQPASSATLSLRDLMRRDLEVLFPRDVPIPLPPSTSYPSLLQTLLSSRYISQSPFVFNEGSPGESATDSGGTYDPTLNRLRAALTAHAPEVLLLQEGANDLYSFGHDASLVGKLAKALRDMIRDARPRGVQVFLGTLLPEDPAGCRGVRGYDLVAPANDQIRSLAASEGVPLIDLYAAYGGVPAPYVPVEDGLHPNQLGYQKIAQAAFDTIRAQLETPR